MAAICNPQHVPLQQVQGTQSWSQGKHANQARSRNKINKMTEKIAKMTDAGTPKTSPVNLALASLIQAGEQTHPSPLEAGPVLQAEHDATVPCNVPPPGLTRVAAFEGASSAAAYAPPEKRPPPPGVWTSSFAGQEAAQAASFSPPSSPPPPPPGLHLPVRAKHFDSEHSLPSPTSAKSLASTSFASLSASALTSGNSSTASDTGSVTGAINSDDGKDSGALEGPNTGSDGEAEAEGCLDETSLNKLQRLVWLQIQTSQTPAETTTVAPEELSVGSVGHPNSCAMPCKFFATRRGCKDGMSCTHCHACHWRSCLRRTRVKKEKRA